MVYSILNKEPKLITSLRSDIPEHIEKTVNKALEKEATKRYQDTHELIQDLKQSPVITFPKAEKSIVVLPFENLSPDPDQEYFCDGMTEEIISDLSGVRVLRVISRSSAMTFKGTKKTAPEIARMTFKGTKKTAPEIARQLNVHYVLEGSVRKAGNNLRITAQLIDATNDTHLWAEKYNGTLNDVFDIQEKVSRSIVDALKLKLSPEENKRIAERTIEDVKAYECYAKARQEMVRWTEDSLEYAFQLLQNGLEIIGENADIYGGLALAYIYTYEIGIKADEETLHKAEEYAEKAEKLQPNSYHYHYILGRIERFRGSALKAVKHFKKALAIEPNDPEALNFQSYLISTFVGKPDSAEPYVKKLMEIDPLTPMNYLSPAFFYLMKGESDLSLAAFRKWLQLDPGNRWGKWFLSRGLSLYGQLNEAFELVDQIVEENSEDLVAVASLFSKYALQREKAKALQILTKNAKKFLWHDPEWPEYMVGYYSLINEKEEAFKWLEHSINRGFINYPFLSKIDPFLKNIRNEARFKKFMERVKHEWENFEV
jgi:non-specific serine/threonine protein kinase